RPDVCLRTTLRAAESAQFPCDRIIFEITEGERIDDVPHVREIVRYYQSRGFLTAIDDFGAGYSGLTLLAELDTDFIKLDMALLRGIDAHRGRQAIVKGVIAFCTEMETTVIAEGVETYDEFRVLQDMGVELFQGYYFARPAFRSLAPIAPQAFSRRPQETPLSG
ncbi:MAG TPA: EAL domain-containing protein, partial [Pirellulales bacterium]